MKKYIILIIFVSFLASCGTTAKYIYPSKPKNLMSFSSSKPKYDKKIAVLPFEELRVDENISKFWLYAIPLSPFGYAKYQRPEAARGFVTISEFQFDASEDLAKSAAYSLRKSNLFSDAFFSYGGDKENADLILEGNIEEINYNGTLYSYGVSVLCPYIWFFGLPAGSSENTVKLKFILKDRKAEKILWENSYSGSNKIIQGLYYNYGKDVKDFSLIMQNIMNQVVADISNIKYTK